MLTNTIHQVHSRVSGCYNQIRRGNRENETDESNRESGSTSGGGTRETWQGGNHNHSLTFFPLIDLSILQLNGLKLWKKSQSENDDGDGEEF